MKTTSVLLAASLEFVFVASAAADDLFTVNTLSDQLVRIDTITGIATPVGPIGYDMHSTDLTYMNGLLYAVTANGDAVFNSPGWTLVAINPATGAKVSSVDLSINGAQPKLVESVAAAGGKLYIGYDPLDTVSRQIGVLDALTGVISNTINYQNILGVGALFGSFGVDLDGMGTDADGKLLAVDTDGTLISVVRIDPVAVTAQGVRQYFFNGGGFGDLAVRDGQTYLFGGSFIAQSDYTQGGNGIVRTINISPLGAYDGVAVPEPSTIVLAGGGWLCLLAGHRRARRTR